MKKLLVFLLYSVLTFGQTAPTRNIGLALSMQLGTKNLHNNTIYSSSFPGSDWSCRVQAAIFSITGDGAIISSIDDTDAGGVGGCTIDPGGKTVLVLLGPTTYTVSQIALRNSFYMLGMGSGGFDQQTILQSCSTCDTTDM